MKIQVLVRLKPGVLDVQGKAVENGLISNGVNGINDVRIGRLIEMDVASESFDEAKKKATTLCEELLANTIIENYEIRRA